RCSQRLQCFPRPALAPLIIVFFYRVCANVGCSDEQVIGRFNQLVWSISGFEIFKAATGVELVFLRRLAIQECEQMSAPPLVDAARLVSREAFNKRKVLQNSI